MVIWIHHPQMVGFLSDTLGRRLASQGRKVSLTSRDLVGFSDFALPASCLVWLMQVLEGRFCWPAAGQKHRVRPASPPQVARVGKSPYDVVCQALACHLVQIEIVREP